MRSLTESQTIVKPLGGIKNETNTRKPQKTITKKHIPSFDEYGNEGTSYNPGSPDLGCLSNSKHTNYHFRNTDEKLSLWEI